MNVSCNWNEQMLQYCSPVFSNRLVLLFFALSSIPCFLSFSPSDSSLFPLTILSYLLVSTFPSLSFTPRLCALCLCCGCAEWLSRALQAMEEMDSKPYQPLSKGRHEIELSYTSSSDESEDGRAHRRSYASRETLPDYTHELRLTLGSHRERQSNYSQAQPGTMLKAYPHCVYLPENIHLELNRHCTRPHIQKTHTYPHLAKCMLRFFKRTYVN